LQLPIFIIEIKIRSYELFAEDEGIKLMPNFTLFLKEPFARNKFPIGTLNYTNFIV
jgi:hypothetical protein